MISFATLPPTISTLRHYAPRQPVDLSSRQVMIIQHGLVNLGTGSSSGEETTLAVLTSGSLLNNLWTRSGGTRSYQPEHDEIAYALTEVALKVVNRSDVDYLLRTQPSFGRELIRALGVRARQLERHWVMVNAPQVRQRLLLFLNRLAEQDGHRQSRTVVIDNFLTHNDLARITNASRQAISAGIKQLEQDGLITYSRRRIVLTARFPWTDIAGPYA